MTAVRRWVVRGLLLVVVLLALLVLGAWLALRGSLPDLDGERPLDGLAADVTLERDALGSASIRARSAADAMRALGFVHAQERLFEMDLLRRSAAGELAELFGPMAVDADRGIRVHRLRARAAAVVAAEPAERRALLDAYVGGVNAGIDALSVRPWAYLLLRQRPRAWTAEDSVLVMLAMFVDLHDERGRRELGLAQLERHLDPRVFALLRQDGTEWDAPLFGAPRAGPVLPRAGLATSGLPTSGLPTSGPRTSGLPTSGLPTPAPVGTTPLASPLDEAVAEARGSNNFAVAGSLTDDGRALVADDMHLGLRAPNLWFRARLVYADAQAPGGVVDVSGVTLPGAPGVIAGSNGHVAWGFTNSYGDWTDWFEVEWLDDARSRYRGSDGAAQARRVEERIGVAGGDPVTLPVTLTEFGPVLVEDFAPGRSLALAWTAHRDGAVDLSLLDVNRAADVAAALAIGNRAGMPAQNLVAGDRSGRIGWTLTGRIPRRVGACDPQLPMRPADGCGWDGWVAPSAAPRLLDPPHARLWTANARVVDGEALALIGDGGYALGARQRQIRDDLFARERFDEQALLDIQLDDRALFLERWWRLLREVVEDPRHADDATLQALSEASAVWDGRASVDSSAYRFARAFRLAVHKALYARSVAPAEAAEGEAFVPPSLPQFEGLAWALLKQPEPQWPPGEPLDRDALLADAARAVVAQIGGPGAVTGESLSRRTWGERNTAAIAHPLAAVLPGFLAGALAMPRQPLPGDTDMPRVQSPDFGASQRFVVAPGHEERGIFHMPGGASGHPLSPFFGAGHADWAEGRPSPFLPGEARHRLLLTPPAGGG